MELGDCARMAEDKIAEAAAATETKAVPPAWNVKMEVPFKEVPLLESAPGMTVEGSYGVAHKELSSHQYTAMHRWMRALNQHGAVLQFGRRMSGTPPHLAKALECVLRTPTGKMISFWWPIRIHSPLLASAAARESAVPFIGDATNQIYGLQKQSFLPGPYEATLKFINQLQTAGSTPTVGSAWSFGTVDSLQFHFPATPSSPVPKKQLFIPIRVGK